MLRSAVLMAFVAATSVWAADEPECSLDKKCPESAPCCGQYHQCGTGAFCLGGCDPRMSFSLESCVPAPVCEDRTLKLNTLDNIQDISEYLGDSTKADWVASGEPALHKGNVLLTMARQSVGTVLSSTVYMWYGTVKARMRTSRGRGVVTAFILFSDVKDEIDYEFVGVDLETAQTNFYYQGITNYENSENITLSDTFSNWHDYEIRWTPDKIEWVIDGKVGRSLERKDTWNKTANRWEFPQTPSRVQLSLWPGGLASNAKGTIDWAGGEIDWDHEDIKNAGFFYATASDVSIECWKADGPLGSNDGVSYTYSNTQATNDTVKVGDDKTTIASLEATGLDPEKGGKKKDEDKEDKDEDKDKEDDKEKEDDKDDEKEDDKDDKKPPPSVPGGGATGNKEDTPASNNNNNNGGSGSGSGSGSDSGDSGVPGGSGAPPKSDNPDCPVGDFNVGCNGDSSSNSNSESDDSGSGNGGSGSSKSSASVLAIVIAGCALYWL